MPQLTVSLPVSAPGDFTVAYTRAYFQERANESGLAELSLRLPLPPIAGKLSVDKSVKLDVRYVPSHGEPKSLSISWSTPDTAAFPSFEGTLTARSQGEAVCRLTLTGSYIPPGGIPGVVFDAIAGRRIARATVEWLLQELRDGAEGDYDRRVRM